MSLFETPNTKPNEKNGILLILDEGNILNDKDEIMSFSINGELKSAQIYINTLAPFIDTRAGSYDMFVLKKMTATRNFINYLMTMKIRTV